MENLGPNCAMFQNLAEFPLRVTEVCMVSWVGCGLYRCSPHDYLPIFHLHVAMLHSIHLATAPPGGLVAKRPSTTSLPNLDAWPRQPIPTAFRWNGPGIWVLWTVIRIGELRYDGVFNESYCPAFFSGVALVNVWCHATDRIPSEIVIHSFEGFLAPLPQRLPIPCCLKTLPSWSLSDSGFSATESHNTHIAIPPNLPGCQSTLKLQRKSSFMTCLDRGTMGHHGTPRPGGCPPWPTRWHLLDLLLSRRPGTKVVTGDVICYVSR